jgi:hypothetical protein
MKPDNGCFVESAIVFGLEVRVQAQGEPEAENVRPIPHSESVAAVAPVEAGFKFENPSYH